MPRPAAFLPRPLRWTVLGLALPMASMSVTGCMGECIQEQSQTVQVCERREANGHCAHYGMRTQTVCVQYAPRETSRASTYTPPPAPAPARFEYGDDSQQRTEQAARQPASPLDNAIDNLNAALDNTAEPIPLFQQGDHDAARKASLIRYQLAHDTVTLYRDNGAEPPPDLKRFMAEVGGELAWFTLFRRDVGTNGYDLRYVQARLFAGEALNFDPSQRWIETNLAHAYMYEGSIGEADAIYERNKGVELNDEGLLWEDVVADDFSQLRAAGLYHPHMDVVLERLGR